VVPECSPKGSEGKADDSKNDEDNRVPRSSVLKRIRPEALAICVTPAENSEHCCHAEHADRRDITRNERQQESEDAGGNRDSQYEKELKCRFGRRQDPSDTERRNQRDRACSPDDGCRSAWEHRATE
jgi:hypothetical protein